MDFNSWLTIISVGITLIALFPKDELIMMRHRLSVWEIRFWALGFFIIIPISLVFDYLSEHFLFIRKSLITTNPYALEANQYGAILCYTVLIWIFLRLSIWKGEVRPDSRLGEYLSIKLKDEPFSVFFKFFAKNIPFQVIHKHQDLFKQILFDQKFIDGITKEQNMFVKETWYIYDKNEKSEILIRCLLENIESDLLKDLLSSNSFQITKNSILERIFANPKNIIILRRLIIQDFTNNIADNTEWLIRFNRKANYDTETRKYSVKFSAYISFWKYLITKISSNEISSNYYPNLTDFARPLAIGVTKAKIQEVDGVVRDMLFEFIAEIHVSLIHSLNRENDELSRQWCTQLVEYFNSINILNEQQSVVLRSDISSFFHYFTTDSRISTEWQIYIKELFENVIGISNDECYLWATKQPKSILFINTNKTDSISLEFERFCNFTMNYDGYKRRYLEANSF